MLLLHDMTTVYRGYEDNYTYKRVWKVFDEYGISTDDNVEFLPYWSNRKYVEASFRGDGSEEALGEYPEPLVSIYSREGKVAIVVVSNLTPEDRDVELHIDFAELGLDPNRVRMWDAFVRSPFPFSENGTGTIGVDGRNFRLIVFKQ